MARKSTGKRLRFEVLKRDGFTCQYCGAHPPAVILVVDHIKPVADGGLTEADNLVTACEPCNQGKAARLLTSIPESLASRAKRTAEAEEQIRGYAEVMAERAARLEAQTWQVAEVLWPGCSDESVGANAADLDSIKRFVEKLGVIKTLELAYVATSRSRRWWKGEFRYFCGCCWKTLRDQEAAQGKAPATT